MKNRQSYHKNYYTKNKKKIQEKYKNYYKENKKIILKKAKNYRKKHKKSISKMKKKYHQKNKEKFNLRSKNYYHNNKKRVRKTTISWLKSSRGRFMMAKHAAKKRKLVWNISYEEYTNINQNKCFYSTKHILPEQGSGLDRIDNNKGYLINNVIPCCTNCNLGRANRYTVTEWKIMINALEDHKEKQLSDSDIIDQSQ